MSQQPSLRHPVTLARRRGDYGFDAPYVPLILGGFGAIFLILTVLLATVFASPSWAVTSAIYAIVFLLSTASYVYTTRIGKFRVWAKLLTGLGLHGNEQALDLGCGRGAVLLMLAQLLPQGHAVGIDLWKTNDQSGNAAAATEQNAAREGVADRVELQTGDMRALPFADGTFDLIVSSLAIHNIKDAAGRLKAVDEAIRVLKPSGRLLIADFRATAEYEARLRERGMADLRRRRLGWRFWYGGPWAATTLVTATKPA